MRILLDPGHGGNAPGAVNTGYEVEEKDINLEVVLALGNILREEGYSVLFTRDRDKSLTPSQRLQMIRDYKPDCFISIHCNASSNSSANGIETIYRDEYDKHLAICVHGALVEATELRNRGIKQDGTKEYFRNLAILKDLETSAILVEIGFISNEDDLEFIESNISLIASAIAEGVEEWVNLA